MSPNHSQRPILVVDDDPDALFLFEMAVSRARLARDVHMAVDGEQAIAQLGRFLPDVLQKGERPPAVVFLDLDMPHKSGFDVLSWLQARPELELPVVVMSDSRRPEDKTRAIQLGAAAFVAKPESIDALAKTAGWVVARFAPN